MDLITCWCAVYYGRLQKNPFQLPANEVTISDYQFSTSSGFISSNGGFAFVERMLDSNAAMGGWNRLLRVGPQRRHRDEAVVRSLVLLMCAGCSNFADVEKFRDDCLFRAALGGRGPSNSVPHSLERLPSSHSMMSSEEWQQGIKVACQGLHSCPQHSRR